MNCKLCLKNKKLCNKSHIIPDFMHRELFDEKHRIIKFDPSIHNINFDVPTGEYEGDILCEDCDNRIIGQYESYAKTVLYGGKLLNKKTLKLNIVDTGTGISDEDKKRLFQKFSRGTASTNLHPDGSGLGLYIAKKIIEGNDGELTYFSAGPGKGSTFSLTIPIYINQNVLPEGKLDYITRDQNIIKFK